MMESSEVTVIHVGFDNSGAGKVRRAEYSDGHLPTARYLKWTDLKGSRETLLPALDRWPALSALGILPGRRVVLYDTGLGLEAAAALVALESVGLGEHAALLDGQWVKWVSEGRPLCRWSEEAGPADLEPGSSEVASTNGELDALVKASSGATLVDARAADHRPSSRMPVLKLPWTQNLAHLNFPVMKSERELRALWRGVPPRGDHRVIVAARNWREAAHPYFVARLLGYSVRILDGSVEDLMRQAAALERVP
jgi:3-mercaptopyruvate sulfurtransferase SseA